MAKKPYSFFIYCILFLINTSYSEKNILEKCFSALDSLTYSTTAINTKKPAHRRFRLLKNKLPKDYSWLDTIDMRNPLNIQGASSKDIKKHLRILKPFLEMHKTTYLDYKRCGFSLKDAQNIIDLKIYTEILPYLRLSVVVAKYYLSRNDLGAATRILRQVMRINAMLASSRLGLANIIGNAAFQFAISKILVKYLPEFATNELVDIYESISSNMWEEAWVVDGILIDIQSYYNWQNNDKITIRSVLLDRKKQIIELADGIEAVRICSYTRIIRSYLLRGSNYPDATFLELSKMDEIIASGLFRNSKNDPYHAKAKKELKRGMANLYGQALRYLDILRYRCYVQNKFGYRISELKTGVFPENKAIVERIVGDKLPLDLITGKPFIISNDVKCKGGQLSKGYTIDVMFCLSP